MRLLWLPDQLREWGLQVQTVHGWQTRGADLPVRPLVVVGHHTATGAAAKGNLPTLQILTHGRSDLPGPLCQIGLGRDGTAYVIAAGKANHAGRGAWGDVTSGSLTVGIEVEHPGRGPWPAAQLAAFDRVAAALLDGLGRTAADYCGHREWALPRGRKVDPGGVDLDEQRRRIHALLARGTHRTPAPTQEDDTVTPQDRKAIVDDVVQAITGGVRTRDAQGQVIDTGPLVSTADLLTRLERVEGKIDAALARP